VLTGSGAFFDDDGTRAGHDVYRGSGGTFDHLYYTGRPSGVRVDLRPGRTSEDRITGIRSVTGGRGDDILIGDDGTNSLEGGDGRDTLRGLAGDDYLDTGRNGHRGSENADGGPGDDEIHGGAEPARLRCGAGVDKVTAEQANVVEPDCELVASAAWPTATLRSTLPAADSAFLLSIPFCEQCSADTWRARAHGHVVATVSARRQPAELLLNAVGRRLLRRHQALTVQIERRYLIPPASDIAVSGFTIHLRPA